jgi:hypothetical protein
VPAAGEAGPDRTPDPLRGRLAPNPPRRVGDPLERPGLGRETDRAALERSGA